MFAIFPNIFCSLKQKALCIASYEQILLCCDREYLNFKLQRRGQNLNVSGLLTPVTSALRRESHTKQEHQTLNVFSSVYKDVKNLVIWLSYILQCRQEIIKEARR